MDYATALIKIGGKIKRKDIPVFIDAISGTSSSLWPNYGDVLFEPKTEQNILNSLSFIGDSDESHLILCSDTAAGGEFDGLEEVLCKLGIPWQRESDSFAEYNGEIVWWQPGMKERGFFETDCNSRRIIDPEPVFQVYRGMKTALSCEDFDEDSLSHWIQQLAFLEIKPPKLPNLEFID